MPSNKSKREAQRESFEYTDGDAFHLLSRIADYVEAFVGDVDRGITVEDLVADLVQTASDRDTASLAKLQTRILDALDGTTRY